MRLFIHNLSFDANIADLEGLLAPFGKPTYAKMPLDHATGKPRGFAFADMPGDAAAEAIKCLDKTNFMGRTLHVEQARGVIVKSPQAGRGNVKSESK